MSIKSFQFTQKLFDLIEEKEINSLGRSSNITEQDTGSIEQENCDIKEKLVAKLEKYKKKCEIMKKDRDIFTKQKTITDNQIKALQTKLSTRGLELRRVKRELQEEREKN